MKRFFTKINKTLKDFKNISSSDYNNKPELVKTLTFLAPISQKDKMILDQRNKNLKSIFNTLKKHEVKLDPWSVGDIYRYHILRQEVEASYKIPPKLFETTDVILPSSVESTSHTQLIGETNTVDINIPINE